jgi:hypothetical protein
MLILRIVCAIAIVCARRWLFTSLERPPIPR